VKKIISTLLACLPAITMAADNLPLPLAKALQSGNVEIKDTFQEGKYINGFHILKADGNSSILYALPDGKLFSGTLIGADGQMLSSVHHKTYIDQHQKDVSNSYTITEGTGSRLVEIFFDPQCDFCKQLWRDLRPYLSEVTIKWIPVNIFDQSEYLIQAIFASNNPSGVFREFNQGYQLDPKRPTTELLSAINKNMTLMSDLGLSQTPSGRIMSGKNQYRVFVGAVLDDILY
jgi:thiol:disulfide interchange protein DsbG